MEEVNESIKFNNQKIEEMEADRKEKEREILELKNDIKTLNEKVEIMDKSLDRHEEYSRRNCLLIQGMIENDKEDTDEVVIKIFQNKMQQKVSANDIDRSH